MLSLSSGSKKKEWSDKFAEGILKEEIKFHFWDFKMYASSYDLRNGRLVTKAFMKILAH